MMTVLARLARGYYYLAPLWLLAERVFWPGFRSGAFAGGGVLGAVVFYALEGGIGAAFWFGRSWAGWLALGENLVYLVAIMRCILITPLDVALQLDVNPEAAELLAGGHANYLPGVIVAGFQILVHWYGRKALAAVESPKNLI